MSFIRAKTAVRTEGRTPSFGSRAATAEARITDTKGRLPAPAIATCLVFDFPKGTSGASAD